MNGYDAKRQGGEKKISKSRYHGTILERRSKVAFDPTQADVAGDGRGLSVLPIPMKEPGRMAADGDCSWRQGAC